MISETLETKRQLNILWWYCYFPLIVVCVIAIIIVLFRGVLW